MDQSTPDAPNAGPHAAPNDAPNTVPKPPARRRALGEVLIAAYAVFAISSGARAASQIVTKFDVAPGAYLLSLLAACVYLVATIAFRKPGRTWFLVALGACVFELAGVLGIGLWTTLHPELFADDTVWSHFGSGYGYVPLVLPFVGLAWLKHVEPETRPAS